METKKTEITEKGEHIISRTMNNIKDEKTWN